jgi:plastocyanin
MCLGALFATCLIGCGGEGSEPAPRTSAESETPVILAQTAATPATLPPTEQPTVVPTAEPTATAAVVASPPPTRQPVPPTAAPPALDPITVTVVARNLSFSPNSLTIPAHVVVTLVMQNQDSGVSHDVGVNVVGGGRTETCPGPCTTSFVFAAHVPGSYHFFCSLHPEMVGDLRVTP